VQKVGQSEEHGFESVTDKVCIAAGYKAIFLSVDVPVLGQRLNEHRNKFELPPGLDWPNLTATGEGLEYGE
jgi:(S)-2-hydroxy-acid oxidase